MIGDGPPPIGSLLVALPVALVPLPVLEKGT